MSSMLHPADFMRSPSNVRGVARLFRSAVLVLAQRPSESGVAVELSKTVADRFCQLVTFEGARDICRGVDLAYVMHGCGLVFGSSAGDKSTFVKSQYVEEIGYFVSHNWSVPRSMKFLVFAFYFNLHIAMVGTFVCGIVLSGLQAAGVIRVDVNELPLEGIASGPFCRFCMFPVFAFIMAFARDGLACLGFRGPALFLDKCCISQDDPQRMILGISKLGAFIAKSRDMIVLYSDIYLFKLWTIYELASFFVLHPGQKLRMLPVYHAVVLGAALLAIYVNSLVTILIELHAGTNQSRYIGDFALGYFCILAFRRWLRALRTMQRRLTAFSIRDSTCAVESDREVVFNNIVCLMRCSGHAPSEATDNEALDAFDAFIQERLPAVCDQLLTRWHVFPLNIYFLCGFFYHAGPTLDNAAARHVNDMPWRICLAGLTVDLFWTLVGFPLAIFIVERVSALCLRVAGRMELGLIPLLLLLAGIPMIVMHTLINMLLISAMKSSIALVLFVATVVIALVLFILLMKGPSLARKYRRASANRQEHSVGGTAVLDVESVMIGLPTESTMRSEPSIESFN